MSHRENSLTPWITSDADLKKDNECMRRTGFPCVRVSPSLYDAGVAAGIDMSGYVKQRPLPTNTLHQPKLGTYDKVWVDEFARTEERNRGTFYDMRMKPGYVAQGSTTGYRPIRDDVVTDRPKPKPKPEMTNTLAPSDKLRWDSCPGKDETDDR